MAAPAAFQPRLPNVEAPIPGADFIPNNERIVTDLTTHCYLKQIAIDNRVREIAIIAAIITGVAVTILLGAALSPIAGFFVGVLSFFVSACIYNKFGNLIKSHRYERMRQTLTQPDFISFANFNKWPLSRTTMFHFQKAYLKDVLRRV